MTVSIDTVTLELLGMPASVRAQLAYKLLASLEETIDPDAEASWLEEVKRRLDEIEQGTVTLISEEDAFREAREGMK